MTIVPPSVDFAAMPLGKLLLRYPGGEQRIERCPRCGRPGKPKVAPGGRVIVHERIGFGEVCCRVEGRP